MKAPRTSSPRVDRYASAVPVRKSAMRMPEHQDVAAVPRQHAFGRRAPELVPMADVHHEAADRNHSFARECRIVQVIDVPVDSFDWRNRLQARKHFAAADVARVNDQLNASEGRADLASKQPVSIGDQTNRDSMIGSVHIHCVFRADPIIISR
jgi:hypothetical protein